MLDAVTAPLLSQMKRDGKKIVCLTAYDANQGAMADGAGVDVVLVGDSLGNVIMGQDTTHGVRLEDVVYHTRATRAGVKRALLVADLPFGSYQSSVEQAVDSAVALVRAGASAVKLEGCYVEAVRAIVRAGIPVMGHVGFTPQSVLAFGGFKIQGKEDGERHRILDESHALEEAGVFAIVLELIPAEFATVIRQAVDVPVIGIGAGPDCDGEIQVFHDICGLGTHVFRHTRPYCDGRRILGDAVAEYVQEVRKGLFPTKAQSS